MSRRTDLAMEEEELWRQSADETTELHGVIARNDTVNGIDLTFVEITDSNGAEQLHKPIGRYLTLDLTILRQREADAFERCADVIAKQLRNLISITQDSSVLVVGLGNSAVTPDAVGPKTLEHLLVTRHLISQIPEHFSSFRSVCAVAPGVLGATGLESVEVVRGVITKAKPDCVIVIDALAACNPKRLCRTVQLSDAGIVPGSGVGNSRGAFDKNSLGVPVISIGVPTVVDACTLIADAFEQRGVDFHNEGETEHLVVTPTEIDADIRNLSRLLGCAINLALHEHLTVDEISILIG